MQEYKALNNLMLFCVVKSLNSLWFYSVLDIRNSYTDNIIDIVFKEEYIIV
jgi:hypothetical protein